MMIMPPTLSRYMGRLYLRNMLLMTMMILSIIYLFDTIELLRRTGKRDDVSLGLVLQMGLLKLPEVGTMIFPFAILFGAMFTFWQLTRRHELVVIRSAGFSVWQFLAPVMGVAMVVGVLMVTVVNPLGALFLTKYTSLEDTYVKERDSQVALFDGGIWLRQAYDEGYVILHAEAVQMPEWQLQTVMALYFNTENQFQRRIDARSAFIQNGNWVFTDTYSNETGEKPQKLPLIALPTHLTTAEIEDSFAKPDTMSFWKLPAFIRTMEQTGFDPTRLQIHFHSLLSTPFLFMSMILLAAAVSMRPPRHGGTFMLIVVGVLIGFLTFFMASFLKALGASHQIPVVLSAWAPALVMMLLGIAAMMNLEDG